MPTSETLEETGARFPETEEEHSKLLREFLEDLQEAEQRRRPFEQEWQRFYRLYRGYVKRTKGDWRSKVFIPICFFTIETITPRLVAQLPKPIVKPVREEPTGEVDPTTGEQIFGSTNTDAAKAMENALTWATEASGLYLELVSAYRSALKYGTGIIKTFHDRKTRTRYTTVPVLKEVPGEPVRTPVLDPDSGAPMVGMDGKDVVDETPGPPTMVDTGEVEEVPEEYVIYDGPGAEAIDIEDFWPAPEASDIEHARFVIHRVWTDSETFADRVEKGIYRLPLGAANLEALESSATTPAEARLSDADRGGATGGIRKRLELHEYWTQSHVITVLDRSWVVRIARNPFRHGEIPFVRIVDHFQEHEFWGVGEIEPLEGIQDGINALWNQRIDNVRLVLNKIFMLREDALVDLRDLELRPGKGIRVAGNEPINSVLQPLDIGDITGSAYTEAAELERMAEKTSSVSAYQTGTDSPDLNATATGVALISESGNSRFSLKVRMAELTGLVPLARHYGSILQQFMPEEMVVRREGPDGGYAWQTITQEGLLGELDYDIEAESSTQTETMRKEDDLSLLQILGSMVDPITQMPVLNLREMAKEILRDFGKKDMDRLLTPEMPMAPPVGEDPEAELEAEEAGLEADPAMNGEAPLEEIPVG